MVPRERLKILARFVADLTTLSKCVDRQVATIIANSDGTQIYSIGVNGGPKGGIDCLCTLGSKYGCVHAEINAIAKCTTTDQNKVMVCSLSPCVTCASVIVNSGFTEVYYLERWKDTAGIGILHDAGIYTEHLMLYK